MCPDLSPVKWRRRSWRSIVSARRENVICSEELIRSSVPVSTRVQEIEKREHVLAHEDVTSIKEMLQRLLDMQSNLQFNQHRKIEEIEANTSEELQATVFELQQVRQTLLEIERKYGFLQRRNEKLEADLSAVTKELEMTRNNLAMYRRSGGSRRKSWKLNQSFDDSVLCCDGTGDNKEEVKELKEEVAVLNKELEKRDAIIENERTAHTAQLKDFIAAVKAAERNREEAQAKVSRMLDLNRTVVFPDDAIWEELMYKFQRSTQRNALLAWADAHLTAYPSISVSNFTSDWCDGRAFCALVHHFMPELIDRSALMDRDQCPQLAVSLASKLGIHIDPSVFTATKPDFRKVMEVVFELYKKVGREQQC